MNTVNDPEDHETVDTPDPPDAPSSPEHPEGAADAAPEAGETPSDSGDTSIYVRRGRTPTLGFWVALAIALPAVAALISSPFFNFPDLGAVVNFVLLAAVLVGLPLAALAAVVDAIRHRAPKARRR